MNNLYLALFIIACLTFAYLIGAIPTGKLVGKHHGVDIMKEGSHNLGGTNVGRVLGFKAAAFTIVIDALKVYLPCSIAMLIMTFTPIYLGGFKYTKEAIVCSMGFIGSLGHSFPVYNRFKGGKCVSCMLGFITFLSPIMTAVAAIMFFSLVKISKKVSVASILTASSMILVAAIPMLLDLTVLPKITQFNGGMYFSSEYMLHMSYFSLIFVFLTASLLIVRHKENIKRIIKKQEPNTHFKRKGE